MSKIVPRPLPVPEPGLADFVSIIRDTFDALFADAHDHLPLTAAPAASAGVVGDIRLVEAADGTFKLYAKGHNGWKSVALS